MNFENNNRTGGTIKRCCRLAVENVFRVIYALPYCDFIVKAESSFMFFLLFFLALFIFTLRMGSGLATRTRQRAKVGNFHKLQRIAVRRSFNETLSTNNLACLGVTPIYVS